MPRFRAKRPLAALVLASLLVAASIARAQIVILQPSRPGGGSATITAGANYVYGLTLINGTANPISDVTAGILGSTTILLVAGNDKLAIVKDAVVNDKCDLPMLAAGGSCTFGLKIFTEDEALGAGGLTADYTVSPTVFYNDNNNSVSVTLKARLVAPVLVPEPGAWMLLIVGSAAALLAKAKLVTAGFAGRRRWFLPSGPRCSGEGRL